MSERATRYLAQARSRWTDITAWVVFLAFVVGLSLLASAVTPAAIGPESLKHLSRAQKLLDAAVIWAVVALALVWPRYGGMAAGILLSVLFALGAAGRHDAFSVLFWLSLAIAVFSSSVRRNRAQGAGVREGG